jgi:hypothetical protein
MPRNLSRHVFSLSTFCAISTLIIACSGGPGQQAGSLDSPSTPALAAQGWDGINLTSYNYADTELDAYGHFKTVPNGCHQDAAGALDLVTWNRVAGLLNRVMMTPTLEQSNEICFNRSDTSKLFGTVELLVPPSPAPSAAPRNELVAAAPSSGPIPIPTETTPSGWPTWLPTIGPAHTPTSTPTTEPTPIPTSTRPITNPTITPTPHTSSSPLPSPSPSQTDVKRTILENAGSQICTTINDKQLASDLVDALDRLADIAYKEDCERVP